VSASDLAEYAYCPRSWWYSEHRSPDEAARSSQRARSRGRSYHDRTLRAEARRERWGAAYAVLLTLAVALVLGGVVWLWA